MFHGIEIVVRQVQIIFTQIGFRIGLMERMASLGPALGALFIGDIDKNPYNAARRPIEPAVYIGVGPEPQIRPVGSFQAVLHIVFLLIGPVSQGLIETFQYPFSVIRMELICPGCKGIGEINSIVIAQHGAEIMAVKGLHDMTRFIAIKRPEPGSEQLIHQLQIFLHQVRVDRKHPHGPPIRIHVIGFEHVHQKRKPIPGDHFPLALARKGAETLRF